jgi:hypothetical protein
MSTLVRFIVGYWLGRVAAVAVLVFIGLLLVGSSPNGPAPEHQAIEQQRSDEAASAAYEEEARERRYGEQPGPPYPVQGWAP